MAAKICQSDVYLDYDKFSALKTQVCNGYFVELGHLGNDYGEIALTLNFAIFERESPILARILRAYICAGVTAVAFLYPRINEMMYLAD